MTTQQPSQWKTWHKIVLSVCAGILVAAVLIAVLAPDPEPTAPKEPAVSTTPEVERPNGQVLAAVRMSLADAPVKIDATRAAEVVDGDTHYVAVPLTSGAVVLVSYKDDAKYLAGLTAVNGTARSNTDLPDGPDTIPAAGERALAAVQ